MGAVVFSDRFLRDFRFHRFTIGQFGFVQRISNLVLAAGCTVLMVCKSQGSLVGGDDFNDNSVDAAKWGADIVVNGGSLTETNSRLEYSSNGLGVQESRRPSVILRTSALPAALFMGTISPPFPSLLL